MTGQRIEIVARSVEIARHKRDVVAAVLLAVGLTQLDAGDFGHRVPFVGRLQWAGQQRVFLDRLRRKLGIDARRAEKQQTIDAGEMGRVNDIGLDRQIVVDEIGGKHVIGVDAADLGGGKHNGIGAILLQPNLDRRSGCADRRRYGRP